jgi:hypothetical protein
MVKLHAGTTNCITSAYNKKHLIGSQLSILNVNSANLAAIKLPSGKTTNVVSASAESAKITTKPAVDKIERVQIPWGANLNALESMLARFADLIRLQILCDARIEKRNYKTISKGGDRMILMAQR